MKTRVAKVAVGAMAAIGLALGASSAAHAYTFINLGGNIAWYDGSTLNVSDGECESPNRAVYVEYSHFYQDPSRGTSKLWDYSCNGSASSMLFLGVPPYIRLCEQGTGCTGWIQTTA